MESPIHKFIISTALLCLPALGTSCDDGRIYPEEVQPAEREGWTARVTGTICGQDTWAAGYEVVAAAFNAESDYALITKSIPSGTHEVDLLMNAVPSEATTVELCVIDRLRQRVATLKRVEISGNIAPHETIVIDVGTMDAGMLSTLQDHVLTPRCAACHGLSATAASGINLTKGHSYAAIVGAPSHRVPDKRIVEPGKSAESVLHLMLNTSLSSSWGYDHGNADISDQWKEIITKWIDNGAKE